LLEHGSAAVIGTHRCGAVPRLGLDLHEEAIAELLEWLQVNAPARDLNGTAVISRHPPTGGGQVAQIYTLPTHTVTMVEQPVVVDPGHELAPILGDRRIGMAEELVAIVPRPRRERRLTLGVEHADVNSTGRSVTPGQGRGLDDERGAIAQGQAQLVQLTTQVRARLRFGGVGPEVPGQMRSGLTNSRVENQVGQQSRRTRRWPAPPGLRPGCDQLLAQ
jgi:hypothetical protein